MKTDRSNVSRRVGLAASCLSLVLSAGVLGGCRGDREDKPPRQFFPDMDDQPKWNPQSKSEFFADGRTMRQPPQGAVPWGRVAFDAEALPKDEAHTWAQHWRVEDARLVGDSTALYQGKNADGSWVAKVPVAGPGGDGGVPLTREMLLRGQERYNVFCAACHNYNGDGKGMVGAQWSYPLPNFHDDRYKKANPQDATQVTHLDGYIFNVIRNGIPEVGKPGVYRMPKYRHALNEADAWAVVLYIRAMQASRDGTIQDVPERLRPEIQRQIGRVGGGAGEATKSDSESGTIASGGDS